MALHTASQNGLVKDIKLQVKLGAAINYAVDFPGVFASTISNGTTPLHHLLLRDEDQFMSIFQHTPYSGH